MLGPSLRSHVSSRARESTMTSESPFACMMDAIAADNRGPHLDNARYLFSIVAEIRELENGYALCMGNDTAILGKLAEFIELEKLCCPFFGFAVIVRTRRWKYPVASDGS